MMGMIWKMWKIMGKNPMAAMIVVLPDWKGSRKKRRREGIWEKLLAIFKMMILKQWTLSSLNLELGWARRAKGKKKTIDEEMIDADAALERETEEMEKINEKFDEKTQKLAQMIDIQ
jgi:hypothetical protein